MSLKAIHLVFVAASLLMTLVFSVWAWREYFGPEGSQVHLVYGVSTLLAMAGLVWYGKYFLKKLKHLKFL